MRSFRLFLALAGAAAGCAKVGPPSGGPVDHEPPRVVAHRPAADTVGVATSTPVEIVFSEGMDRRRTEEAVFVAPESARRYHWHGRRLRLDFAGGLQPKRTYVLTVGTGARDLRGNALETSFTFAFATGPQLDQGRILGRVFERHQPAARAHVWAYDLEHFEGKIALEPPTYRTQSGSDGTYEFSRLAAGSYLVLAFVDKDRDRSYGRGEPLALPAHTLEVGQGEEVEAGDLALAGRGEQRPALERVQALDSRRLLLLFDREVEPQELEIELKGLAVEALYGAAQEGRKVYVQTAPQQGGKAYAFARLRLAGESLEWKEGLRGNGRADRTPPALLRTLPAGKVVAAGDTLRLLFSEAMEETIPEHIWVESDSTQAPPGRWQWEAVNVLRYVPEAPFVPGKYRLRGRTGGFKDRSGLALKDSAIVFEFEVPAAADLARLEGRVLDRAGGPADARVVVGPQEPEGPSYHVRTDAEGHYAVEGLLSGRYVVYAFADLDGDGVQDYGVLEPFAPAEPYARYGETVTLEAGQSAGSIELHLR